MKELTLDGSPPIKRDKDGTFEVSDFVGKRMLRGGEFARSGMTFHDVKGFRCRNCGHLGLFRTCKCGSTNVEDE